jgi:murein DD-endopeptidase MepM/ murein hydrolase activator NlpD
VLAAAVPLLLAAGAGASQGAVPPEPPFDAAIVAPPQPRAVLPEGVVPAVGGWGWPLRPAPQVLHRFDPPDVVWEAGHRGVDLAATVGQDVLAPSSGVVSFSGIVVDRGVLVVTASNGLRSSLEPVDGVVPVGTAVQRGDLIGRVGAAPGHCGPATCLHWGVRRGEAYLDPVALVVPRRVILLPLLTP